jgi:hypothetical protein
VAAAAQITNRSKIRETEEPALTSRRPMTEGVQLLSLARRRQPVSLDEKVPADIKVLEVTAPNRGRRKRGKNDDLDAQNAAHAARAGRRTVTPKSRDGTIEALRVFETCRKTATAPRRAALQMIQSRTISAPDELRKTLLRCLAKAL